MAKAHKARKGRRVALVSAAIAATVTVAGSIAFADTTPNDPSATTTTAGAQPADVQPSSAPRLPQGARVGARVASGTQLHLSVHLKPRDQRALDQFVGAVTTPGNPRYRHFLAKGQFAKTFGPTAKTVAHVEAELRAQGLTVGRATADGLTIPVTATAAQAERVFGAQLNNVKLADGSNGIFNQKATVLPAGLSAQVDGVTGLTDVNHPRPFHSSAGRTAVVSRELTAHALNTTATASAPALCSGLVGVLNSDYGATDTHGYYSPAQLAKVYGLASGATAGAGQTIAVYELESVDVQSLLDYQSCLGLPQVAPTVKYVGAAAQNPAPSLTDNIGVESLLDLEDLAGLVPGATLIDYEGQDAAHGMADNALDVYHQMVMDDQASVLSVSWGLCEAYSGSVTRATENTYFQQAAAQGQTVVVASGDSGSSGCYDPSNTSSPHSLAVDDPASQPYATAVGGTSMSGSGSALAQSVWNDGPAHHQDGASGGGVSRVWPAPVYQGGFSSHGTRTVPDVAADADPYSGYPIVVRNANGADTVGLEGGTSAAAPTMAALVAQANASSSCVATGRKSVGFINPALYDQARLSYARGYYDITSGGNALPGLQPSSAYPATSGYDLATGLGAPKLAGLVGTLCRPVPTAAATGVSTYHTLATPQRALDTYNGRGWGLNGSAHMALPGGGTAPVLVEGRLGVPNSGVTAVTLNVTATSVGGDAGGVIAFPDGGSRGAAQVYWTGTSVHRSSLVTVPVPANGIIDFWASNSVHLAVDVQGYWAADTTGASYVGLAGPSTVLDTRKAVGVSRTTAASNIPLTFKVTGALAPSSVKAVALNIEALYSTGSGFLEATVGGGSSPGTFNVAWTPGTGIVNNTAIVPVNPSTGTVTIWVSGTTHVTADVKGYFMAPGAAGATGFQPSQSTRVFSVYIGAGHAGVMHVAGASGSPVPANAKFVLLNLTALNSPANGSLVAYGAVKTYDQDSYWIKGQTQSNLVLVPVNPSTGSIVLRVIAAATVTGDVQGWFA